jgi:hypothetical protein
VVFRGWFVPEPPTALDAEPEQHHVANSQSMTEAEAEADYWAHHDAQSGHGCDAEPASWPDTDTVPSVLLNPLGNSDARLGHRPARINGTELWTSEGLSAAIHASAAHIAAYHGDVGAALAAAKGAGPPDTRRIDVSRSPVQLAADDGTPRNNQAQNKKFRAVARLLRLNKDQQTLLHEEISGQNYGYREILNAARDMFGE